MRTRTFTYEERVWELALEATDPATPKVFREHAEVALDQFLAEMPEQSRARCVTALRRLVFTPEMNGVILPLPTDSEELAAARKGEQEQSDRNDVDHPPNT